MKVDAMQRATRREGGVVPREHGFEDESAAATREAPVLLSWSERTYNEVRWWETAPVRGRPRRGMVLWLRSTGKLVWRITEGEETLAVGTLPSLEQPPAELYEKAMEIVERLWAEV